MKVSDLKFTVELKSSYAARSKFPSDDVVSLIMVRPDKNKNVYKLKIAIPEAACKRSQIKPMGYIMANISDCSSALQILYEDEQGVNFKGYGLRPLGAYKNKEEIAKAQKEKKSPYMSLYAEVTIPFEVLDTTRSQPFPNKFAKIVSAGKHNMVIDIQKNIPIFVPKS